MDPGPIFDRLLRIIRKRHFAAGLTGPPCETFSAARHSQLPDGRHPRPLRLARSPSFLRTSTGRELHQTMVGTRLLFHSLIVEVELAFAGAGTIMGHPTEHPDTERVSVWRTQCHQRLVMALPNAHHHHIEQWRYGSAGVKPTTLRAVNHGPSSLVQAALEVNTDLLAVRPRLPLRGRNLDGSFKTAAAKEYPSALCRALILATISGIKHRLEHCGIGPSPPCPKRRVAGLIPCLVHSS